MKKKFLVTGGAGFIGSAIVCRLVKEGYPVRVLDDGSRGALRRLSEVKGSYEFVRADIRDAAAVLKAAKGMDSILHLAFINGTQFFYEKPEMVLDVGVKGMLNVIDAGLKWGIPELVLASSSEVYQNPPRVPTDEDVPLVVPDVHNPRYSYGAGKIISEVLALNWGRKHFKRVIIFRPHNVYGPDMGWEHVLPQFAMRVKALLDRSGKRELVFPIQGSGRQTRAFIEICDFTEGLMKVLEKGRHQEIYHIGTQEEVSILQAAKEVGRYFGVRLRVSPSLDAPKGGTPRRCPDITKLSKLGFRPKVSFSEGVDRLCEWYARHGHLAPKQKKG